MKKIIFALLLLIPAIATPQAISTTPSLTVAPTGSTVTMSKPSGAAPVFRITPENIVTQYVAPFYQKELPRITTTAMNALPSPTAGTMIFNITDNKYYSYISGAWTALGITGATGATGAQGIQGIQGVTGSTGIQGITGNTGATGIDMLRLTTTEMNALPTPLDGTLVFNITEDKYYSYILGAWTATAVTGATGATGTAGTNGTNGTNGSTGATGSAGTNGTNGTNGSTGATGATGVTGAGTTGATGATGSVGATGPGGVMSIAAVGATPNANGATLTGSVYNLEPASASFPGVVTTGTQTFAGTKTFTSLNTTPWSLGSGNEMWALNGTAADATGYINYSGYNAGTTYFRSTVIGNGKGAAIATFNGTTSVASFTNPIVGSITGNAATVTTLPALSGVVTTTGSSNITSFGTFASSTLMTALTDETGTGVLVGKISPIFTTNIRTPNIILDSKFTDADSGVYFVQNGTSQNFAMREKAGGRWSFCRTSGLTAPYATVIDFLEFDYLGHVKIEGVQSTGATGTGKFMFDASPTLTGVPLAPTAAPGTNTTQLATTAFVTTASATNANLTGVVTSVGNATSIANGAISNAMLANAAVANLSGTNTGDQTNISGNSATVTTNANLTGVITSVGNATSIASQTGTGTTFVTSVSPTFTGSPVMPALTLGDNQNIINTVKVSLTAAECGNLASSPKLCIAAPGSGYAIRIISASGKMNFGTTAYTSNSTVELYTTGSTLYQYYSSGLLAAAINMHRLFAPKVLTLDVNGTQLIDNAALYARTGGNAASGDGTLDIYITYELVKL
jgi:Collagen triple helix repeat (20 copies)